MELERELRAKIDSGKISAKSIKDFLKKYFDGDPECVGCPTGCKQPDQCYIDIHLNLIDDCEVTNDFGYEYIRDDQAYCCGRPLDRIEKHKYCTACGNEY